MLSWFIQADAGSITNLTLQQCHIHVTAIGESRPQCLNHLVQEGSNASNFTLNTCEGTEVTLLLYQGYDVVVNYTFDELQVSTGKS